MNEDIKFPLLSGDLAVDLVNTEVMSYNQRHDLLAEPSHLIAWVRTLIDTNFIDPIQVPPHIEQWAKDALPNLRSLRAFLRLQLERLADGLEAEQQWTVQLEAMIKRAPHAFRWDNEQLLPVPVGAPEDVLPSLIAFYALELLASDRLTHVHRCGNPECVLLYIDSNPRRKWCSMKICGNRIKVTRHQKQKKQE